MATVIDLNGAAAGTDNTTIYTAQTPVVIAPSATVESQNTKQAYTQFDLTLTAPSATETLSLSAAGQTIATKEQVTANYTSGTGTLVLKSDSTETDAVWTSLLQTVTYNNTSATPSATETVKVTGNYEQGNKNQTITATDTITLAVPAVNATPTVTTGATLNGSEDTTLVLSGITIADADAGSTKLTTTLTAASGTLAGTSTASVTVTGSTTAVLSLNGTVTNVNTYISSGGVTYTGAKDANGSTTIGISVTDDGTTGTGGPKTGTGQLTVNLAAVNDAPIVTMAGSTNVTAGATNPLTGIVFQDVDAGGAAVSASFNVNSGTLTATSSGGVTVSTVGGLTLTGSVAAINAYVAAGKIGFAGTNANAVLTTTIDDKGNTGNGGALTGSKQMTLNAVIDASSPDDSGTPIPFDPPTARPRPSGAGVTADAAFGNVVGVDTASPKAATPSVTLPDGRLVENVLFTEVEKSFALQTDLAAGKITQKQFADALAEFAADTTGLAVQEYQFFTGKTATRDALNFAVNSSDNARDLTDTVYAGLSQTERYITFAVDLVKNASATASFQSAYGSLSFEASVRQAIGTIIGSAAGFNLEATVAKVLGQQAYLQSFGGGDIGAKAAMVGYVLDLGMQGHVGAYYNATHNFLADLYDGRALFAVNLVGTYSAAVDTV